MATDKLLLSDLIEKTENEPFDSEISIKILVSNTTGKPVQADLYLFGPDPTDPVRIVHRFTLIEG